MNADRPEPGATRAVVRWQLFIWTRTTPGPWGIGVLVAAPALLLLPIEKAGLFSGWYDGARAALGLGTFAFAAAVGRDVARQAPEEIWLFQKGASLADWGLNRWWANLAIAFVVLLWWTTAFARVAVFRGEPVSLLTFAAILLWLVVLFGLSSALLFAVGAGGSDRGVDALLLLGFASILEPIFLTWLSGGIGTLVGWLIPPFLATAEARAALTLGEPARVVLVPLLEVGIYATLLLALGVALLSRRRPRSSA